MPRSFATSPLRLLVGGTTAVVAAISLLGACTNSGKPTTTKSKATASDFTQLPSGELVPGGQGPMEEPSSAWKVDVDCTKSCRLATAGDTVFVASEQDDEYGVNVTAYAIGDGMERWTKTGVSSGRLRSADVLGDRLIIGTDRGSAEATALNLSSGDEEWTLAGSWADYMEDDLALFSVSDSRGPTTKTRAVSLASGNDAWIEQGRPAGICDGVVYLVEDTKVVARSLSDGEERWSSRVTDLEDVTCSSDGVFAVANEVVLSFGPSDGVERWTRSAANDAKQVQGINGLVLTGGDDTCEALNASDGERVWDVDSTEFACDSISMFPLGGSKVATANQDRDMVIADLDMGDAVANRKDVSLGGSPFVSSDVIVVHDGEALIAYAIGDGTLAKVWSIEAPSGFRTADLGSGAFITLTDSEVEIYA